MTRLHLAAAWIVDGMAALRARVPAQAFRPCVVALVAALAVSAFGEHRRFEKYFVAREVPDLATPWLTK